MKEFDINCHFEGCFEGIKTVECDNQNNITHIISKEGEKVKLCRCVCMKDKEMEMILKEVEEVMKETIRSELCKSFNNYKNMKSPLEWIRSNPSQCSTIASQIWWANDT